MIIYGNVVGVAVTQLFIAGIIPGLLLAGLFMLVVLSGPSSCPCRPGAASATASSRRSPSRRRPAVPDPDRRGFGVSLCRYRDADRGRRARCGGRAGHGCAPCRVSMEGLYETLLDTVRVSRSSCYRRWRGGFELGLRLPTPAARDGAARHRCRARALVGDAASPSSI